MKDLEVAKRHTAEHIFMRTLTNMLERVRVVKVEHGEDINKVFLEAESITWEDVVNAAKTTNKVIQEDRIVRIEYFESLDEAKKKYSDIRAYESRISGRVRLVIIDDYDVSACKMPHVEKTGECIMFLPVSLAKVKGNLYEVKYYAGEDAIYKALEYTDILVKIMRKYNVSKDKIYNFLENLEAERKRLSHGIKELTEEIVSKSPIRGNQIKYIYLNLPYLDINIASRIVARRLEKDIDMAIIISFDGEKYRLSLASRSRVDISELGRNLLSIAGGRGGGRRGWFMGYIEDIDSAEEYLDEYLKDL